MGSGKGSDGQVHILAFHILKKLNMQAGCECVTNFPIMTALQTGSFTTRTYTVAWS